MSYAYHRPAALVVCLLAGCMQFGCWPGECKANGVYIVANTVPTGGGGSTTGVYQFDRQGVGQGAFGQIIPGSYFSIATNGIEFFVGSTGDRIRRFSLTGDYLGYFDPRSNGTPRLEFDVAGNLYGAGVRDGAVRFNPDGSNAQVFPPIAFTYAIDADALGNVYVRGRSNSGGPGEGLFKYTAAGSFLGFTSTSMAGNDISIDEANGRLYLSQKTSASSIGAYDITGPAPAFLGSIPTPGLIDGISFDASTGHLLGVDVLAGRGYELTTAGAVVQTYEFGGAYFPFDIVALPNPEPSTLLLAAALFSSIALNRKLKRQQRT